MQPKHCISLYRRFAKLFLLAYENIDRPLNYQGRKFFFSIFDLNVFLR